MVTTISNRQTRSQTLKIEESKGDRVTFSFSSNYAVDRGWGKEILSHAPDAADFSRVEQGAVHWLFNHDRDYYLGVIKRAWLSGDRGYCEAEWAASSKIEGSKTHNIRRDFEADQLPNVSFLYEIPSNGIRPLKDGDYEVIRWQVFEISSVTVPADPSVGYLRNSQDTQIELPPYKSTIEAEDQGGAMEDEKLSFEQAKKDERLRSQSIRNLCREHGLGDELADTLIDGDKSIEEARSIALEKILERGQQQPLGRTIDPVKPLGLTKKEERQYSIFRAIEAWRNKDWSQAGLEREISQEITKQCGVQPQGFYVPYEDLKIDLRSLSPRERMVFQRDPYSVGTAASAGNLVQTTLDTANFIDVLRNKARVFGMGVRILRNLTGNLDIPRQTGVSTAYWLAAENEAVSESRTGRATFDLVSFRPKTIGAKSSITRTMRLQSSMDIEMLVRMDLIKQIALEIDRVVIDGSGVSGQPRGILNTSGIGAGPSLGTNGGAITYNAVIDLETAVATANADENALGYLTNAKVIGALKKLTASGSGEYLWNGTDSGLMAGTPGMINGYPVTRSNQVPSNKTKASGSNLSCLIFGDWSQVYFAEWGVLDLLPNELGAGYDSGAIELRALQTCDIQLGHVESFAASTEIST